MAEPAHDVGAAVRHFWKTRQAQAKRQTGVAARERDRGARAAVTGGQQMDGFVELFRKALQNAGVPAASIHSRSRLEVPGWFRAEKEWDLLVVHEGQLVIAAEFKSQVGPSFGNNFNNRTEEALGSATDVWAAFREGAFKPSARPWLGYLMLLEDCDASASPVRVKQPHFAVFPVFNAASYRRRYEVLVERLVRERLYDGACLLTSPASAARTGAYAEPHAELSLARFVGSAVSRVAALGLQGR